MKLLFSVGACLSAALLLAACGGSLPQGAGPAPPSGDAGVPPGADRAQKSTLYTFKGGADGWYPWAGLLFQNGQLYGTTFSGGTGGGSNGGYGTVFKISTSGTKSTLYAFQNGADGANPQTGLTAGPGGVLYGATVYGGGAPCSYGGCGTVYQLIPSGSGYTESPIHSFQGGSDGAAPIGGLLVGQSGALYGTTVLGGGSHACSSASGTTGCGTVFELMPSGSGFTESVLYSFQAGSDGIGPRGTLIADGAGALYGTTAYGGGASACSSPSYNAGCGTVFKLTPSGSGYTESILHSFQGGTDGSLPRAGLVAGSGGTLFGATTHGGTHDVGTVYELTPSGSGYSERVIFSFDGKRGRGPSDENGLYSDGSGNLYGTAFGGGTKCNCGVVFKLIPSRSGYKERVLYNFKGSRRHDGRWPRGSLTGDSSGALYGTTTIGGLRKGKGGYGMVFKISPNGGKD